MRLFFLYISFFIAVFCAGKVSAQEKQPLFHTVDEQDGLVNDLINCIEIDDYGYVWTGCKSGLCRYDGQNFQIFSTSGESKKNYVAGNTFSDLEKDINGRIWIASERGVTFYNPTMSSFTFVEMLNPNDGKKCSSYQADKILISSEGAVYLYSTYAQLFKFNEQDTLFHPVFYDVLSDKNCRYCYIDKNNNFWLLSDADKKVYKMSPFGDILRTVDCSKMPNPPTKGSFAFLDNGNGEIFFGGDNGLVVLNQNTGNLGSLDAVNLEIFPETETKCFLKDSRGLIWIGTNARELFIYNPETKFLTKIPSASNRVPYRLTSSSVIDMREDRQGLLWFGTWKGLSYTELNPTKKFHNVSNEEAEILPGKNYVDAFDSYNGMMAIGCDGGGVTFWKKGAPEREICFDPEIDKNSVMDRPSVLSLCFDKDGYLYNGGYNRAVTRIHPDLKGEDEYPLRHEKSDYMSSDFTADIICDSKNRIWLMTNGDGLYELTDKKKGTVKRHNVDKNGTPICCMWGTCLSEYEGKILVGSYQGISVYDVENNVFTNYECDVEDSTTISHNWVADIFVDSKDRIWVGTSYGLNLFDINSGKFRRIVDCGSGFLSDDIKGVLEDKKTGLLWISTAKGIAKFDTEKLKVVRTYLSSDGLLSENFSLRGAYCDPEGTMFFGVANGFVYFDPEEISDNIQLPMPTITGLMINYNRVTSMDENSPLKKAPEATEGIELSADQSTFTIEFTSLNFVNEAGNRYFYYLEGYDKDWIDIGSRHEITFTNLDAGFYIFQVKCQNADGRVSDIRPLKILVHPHFYKTWWFYTLEVLSVVFFVLLIYWYRTRRLKESQKELEEMVKSRTEELVKANDELTAQKEEILRQSQEIELHRDELISKNEELELSRKEISERNEEIEKSLKNIMVLNNMSRQITSSFDMTNIVIMAYNHLTQILRVDLFTTGIFSSGINSLEFKFGFISGKVVTETAVPCRETSYAEIQCYTSNSDVFLKGEECGKSFFKSKDGKLFGSICLLPLIEGSKANGVLVVGSFKENYFSDRDIANIRMISSYVSIAIDKARDYGQLRAKNNAINGSIRYAKTIQDAILVQEETINRYFSGMVIFRPKDIVSGDFYWFKTIERENGGLYKIFAADVDCTGHGVPGAFMSLISNTLLTDIIIRSGVWEPDKILALLDREIKLALHQEDTENNDGLDMAICRFDVDENGEIQTVAYSGAKNPLYYYSKEKDELSTIAADRISIGGFNSEKEKIFTCHTFVVKRGDMFFMSSDGIIDQNNKDRKRFGSRRFMKVITDNCHSDMKVIKNAMETALDEFMGGVEQRDDISVMGLGIV